MTLPRSKKIAQELRLLRERSVGLEVKLRESLDEELANGEAVKLAEAIDISPQHLSDIRAGKRGITDGLLCRLQEAEY